MIMTSSTPDNVLTPSNSGWTQVGKAFDKSIPKFAILCREFATRIQAGYLGVGGGGGDGSPWKNAVSVGRMEEI